MDPHEVRVRHADNGKRTIFPVSADSCMPSVVSRVVRASRGVVSAHFLPVGGELAFTLQTEYEISRDSVVANYIDRVWRERAMALRRVEMV